MPRDRKALGASATEPSPATAESSEPETSKELGCRGFASYQEFHRATARYRIMRSHVVGRAYVKSEVSRGWNYDAAKAECDRLQALVPVDLVRRMGDDLYFIQLTNGWEWLSDEARSRMLALGKKPSQFDC